MEQKLYSTSAIENITFNNNGKKVYICLGDQFIYQYKLTNSFDISGIFSETHLNVARTLTEIERSQGREDNWPIRDLRFNINGEIMYVMLGTNYLDQYNLDTVFDISTAQFHANNYHIAREKMTVIYGFDEW